MIEHARIVVVGEVRQAHQCGIVAEPRGHRRLAQRLLATAADARHAHEGTRLRSQGIARGLGGEREDRFEQCVLAVPDGELRGVDTHGDAAGAGMHVIARECALVPFVETPGLGERERVRGDHLAGEEVSAEGISSVRHGSRSALVHRVARRRVPPRWPPSP